MPVSELCHALDADSLCERLLLTAAFVGALIGSWLFLFADL